MQTIWHLGQAAILGLVQGITEFLPISSSGHLIVARELLHLNDPGIFFDAVLHLATLLAVLIYFREDWWQMLFSNKTKSASKKILVANRRLLWLIILATIPGLIVGLVGSNWIESHWRSLVSVAALMIVMGLVYLIFEKFIKLSQSRKNLTSWDALSIGLSQALAILPGISRSGATLLGGMYVGLSRAEAARFSFLMAAPVVAAAGGYGLYESLVAKSVSGDYGFWLVAFVASFISGLLAIGWLLKFYQKYSLKGFAYYLVIAGLGLLAYHFLIR